MTPEPPDFPASQLFLRRLAYSLVRDEARAEDLVQETWATWVEERPSGLAEPRAWLARVLRNRAFNQKRGDARRAEREELSGRPDASAPEIDGTLEAQAQLIEALRHLEEPYRSALVERYYHDLSPREIAERSGTPLNTIKARLVRGLAKLREAMDRRYGGDRSAWCHWLTILGAPPIAAGAPAGSGRAAPASGGGQGLAPFAGVGGSGGMTLLGWLVLGAVLVAGAVMQSGWGRAPHKDAPVEDRQASVPLRETVAPEESGRVEVPTEAAPRRAKTPLERPESLGYVSSEPEGELPARAAIPALAESFDWPQYGGGPDHANYREIRDRQDEVFAPSVQWFMPGCEGQPTIEGGELYTGGLSLLRLDPDTGMPLDMAGDLFKSELSKLFENIAKRATEGDAESIGALMGAYGSGSGELDLNDKRVHTVAPAPVLTAKLVLARRTRGGGVVAFDRALRKEIWRWDSGWEDSSSEDDPATRIPLCLTDGGIVLVNLHRQIVALSESDGRELWRHSVNGSIEMVPAESEGVVFFGTDKGQLVALAASTGQLIWERSGEGFGSSAPIAFRGSVFVTCESTTKPGDPQPPMSERLRAWDANSGALLWEEALFPGRESTGLCVDGWAKSLIAYQGASARHFSLSFGKVTSGFRELRLDGEPTGAPAVVGKSLVVAQSGGRLSVYDLSEDRHKTGESHLRWAFQLPGGAEVEDFVATGRRIYLATSIGLFCLADDPSKDPPEDGTVLEWDGNPREPSYVNEGESAGKR